VTVHLTVPGVIEAMTAAVEARGRDYVYRRLSEVPACRYVLDGRASCLAGDTLARCGVPLAELARWEHAHAGRLLAELRMSGVITYEPRVVAVLRAAQQRQDYGSTWGVALDAAVLAARAVAS